MEHHAEYHYENNSNLEINNNDYKIIKTKNNVITKIEKIITIKNLTDSFTNRLTKYSMSVIKSIIKVNPEFIITIENIVIRNIRDITDNGIDANDIYEIIIIMSKIYNIILVMNFKFQKNMELTAEICGYIVRFIISVCIQDNNLNQRRIKSDPADLHSSWSMTDKDFNTAPEGRIEMLSGLNNKELLVSFEKIIDACVKLLQLKNPKEMRLLYNNDNENYNSDDDYENEAPVVVKEYGSCCF